MKISTLVVEEIARIKPLWESLNKVHHTNSNNWKKHFTDFTFEKRMESIRGSEKFSVFISINDDDISGYCIASINEGVGEIDSIFVKKQYRKALIGKKLVEKSIEWLESQKIHSIKVGIAEGNESVLPFYEKLGFKKSLTILKKDGGGRW